MEVYNKSKSEARIRNKELPSAPLFGKEGKGEFDFTISNLNRDLVFYFGEFLQDIFFDIKQIHTRGGKSS